MPAHRPYGQPLAAHIRLTAWKCPHPGCRCLSIRLVGDVAPALCDYCKRPGLLTERPLRRDNKPEGDE